MSFPFATQRIGVQWRAPNWRSGCDFPDVRDTTMIDSAQTEHVRRNGLLGVSKL
jgi:hypothetical protein